MRRISWFIVAGLLFAFAPSEAGAWDARALGRRGAGGWARSDSLERARRIAFGHCSARSRGCACRIRSWAPQGKRASRSSVRGGTALPIAQELVRTAGVEPA